ncbi:hypothetical protein GMO_00010 [Gluconobacter morbifer G707]|uniref:Uncharacterized protein n=1 Tax=Gluconobacter morbifer G707 TaxID=1088869 RepID=G6XET6_9PROT|nr:hypothetical protein GMO_00010 [Gluconobacter morbifer G707]
MKRSRFSTEQIIGILNEQDAGRRMCVGVMASAKRHFTKGGPNMAG